MRPSNKRFLRKLSERQFHIYAFFIPSFIMMVIFAILQVHPFATGENMILTVDCYHQYAPFLVETRNKILSGQSLFFSWNVGLGTNYWAVFANYSASPLNILAIFFPPKYVGDCIAFLAILRCGLTGLFMSYLLKELDKGRRDLFLTSFSSAYALCGWAISYFWNIMWHDAVVLLPLIVLGLIKMFRDKKPLLYCISLAVCLISNFYSGYFVCLFLVFYAPILYVSITEKITLKNFWSAVWRFAVYSLIGGGLSAFLTLSTYITLQKSSATGGTFPKEFTVMNDMFDFISRFLIAPNPNIRDGMANVYCGVFVAMLIPLFFLCKKIRLREKIAYGVGLAIMYVSLSSRMMTYIWHGFHFPNQIPYRQAFLISFLVVIMGYKVLRNLKSFTKRELMVPCMCMIGYLILYEKIGEGEEGYLALGLSFLFLILYTAAMRVIGEGKKSAMFQQILLFSILTAELATSTIATVSLVAAHESFTGWEFYASHYDEVQQMMEESEEKCEYGFERSEIYPAYICNQPALYNMKGISIFTSTARESFVKFIKNLGFHNNGINSMRNFGMTEVTGTLFGVRNMYDIYKTSPIPFCFKEVESGTTLRKCVNPDALALGYMVDPAVLEYHMNQTSVPFISTSAFVKSLGISGDVFTEVELELSDAEGMSEGGGNSRTGYKYTFTDKKKAQVVIKPLDVEPGTHLYVYVVANKGAHVKINDKDTVTEETKETSYSGRSYQILDIGYMDENCEKTVTISFNEDGLSGNLWIQCARVVEPMYREMVEKLSDEQMKVVSYDSTHVEGIVTAQNDGVLFLTIPYDENWTAMVDGMSAEVLPIDDAFMGLKLSSGTHNISLEYYPAKFKLCVLISVASVLALIFLTVIRRIRESLALRKRMEAVSDEDAFDAEEPEDA
ncbi:MAG: YfhO family protein [Clostridiales bacterium]|nr:YfhO family protein [Clostridiales bacterium]